jgi:regulator of sirC expression with transglutaminase-like and TPR domain
LQALALTRNLPPVLFAVGDIHEQLGDMHVAKKYWTMYLEACPGADDTADLRRAKSFLQATK